MGAVIATFVSAALLHVRRRWVVRTGAAALLVVSVLGWLGIQSAARLAEVRAEHRSLRTSNVLFEGRDIAADWAVVILICNVGLVAAVVVPAGTSSERG